MAYRGGSGCGGSLKFYGGLPVARFSGRRGRPNDNCDYPLGGPQQARPCPELQARGKGLQPKISWIEDFAASGFKYDEKTPEEWQERHRERRLPYWWGENLMVFHRGAWGEWA
jgi:hypothetical protein